MRKKTKASILIIFGSIIIIIQQERNPNKTDNVLKDDPNFDKTKQALIIILCILSATSG